MALPFPFGTQQTLSIGSLSLTLNNLDYRAEDRLGYMRVENPSHQVKAEESIYGTTILSSQLFEPKHVFSWRLQLNLDEAYKLKAIWLEQQHQIRTGSNLSSAIAVRLDDQRLAFMGRTPRNRAKIGSLIGGVTPPTGYSYYWARFNILLELNPNSWDFHYQKGTSEYSNVFYKFDFTAQELDIVPVSQDI